MRTAIFFRNDQLTVCQGMCDRVYRDCGKASVDGRRVRDIYASGTEMCEAQRFQVGLDQCFEYFGSVSGASLSRPCALLVLMLALATTLLFEGASSSRQKNCEVGGFFFLLQHHLAVNNQPTDR